MNIHKILSSLASIFIAVYLSAQNTDDTNHAIGSHTIVAGVYTLTDGDYIDTGRILTFDSHAECQVWSRSATADEHSDETHDHWNAAGDVFFDDINRTFTWTEYGPELDYETVEQLCLDKEDGVTKTIDETNYYKDKANLYLRIISIEENDDFTDTNDSWDEGEHYSHEIPVFYLSANDIEVLSSTDGAEGYYGIYKDSSWDETTNAHVFEYWLEPAKWFRRAIASLFGTL